MTVRRLPIVWACRLARCSRRCSSKSYAPFRQNPTGTFRESNRRAAPSPLRFCSSTPSFTSGHRRTVRWPARQAVPDPRVRPCHRRSLLERHDQQGFHDRSRCVNNAHSTTWSGLARICGQPSQDMSCAARFGRWRGDITLTGTRQAVKPSKRACRGSSLTSTKTTSASRPPSRPAVCQLTAGSRPLVFLPTGQCLN